MSDCDDIVKEFLVESYENLDRLDQDLVALEKDPRNQDTLGSIFRTIHTIKGTCGFFGFSKLEAVTHVGENLLSRLRDGLLTVNPDIATALLTMVDAVRQMLASIETAGHDGTNDYAPLVATLTSLLEPTPATAVAPAAPVAPAAESAAPDAPKAKRKPRQRKKSPASAGGAEPEPPAPMPTPPPAPVPVVEPVAAVEHCEPESDAAPAAAAANGERAGAGVSESSIRVDVGLLDKLMNLVGELVLTRNQVLQYSSTQKDAGYLRTTQRLNLITTELQEGVMKTRMQPIGNIWNKFPRVVRDLAVLCGKQVRLVMEGKETELDKTIIEAIKDPLTHLVRNTIDHGIEPADVRRAKGKPAEGCLVLRAFHEGGQVNIEITDDGAGINGEKVRQRAVERGLIGREQAARMTERELAQLIFLPGFSTAEKITNVSGRGVGMDVVKTNIEKIGGTVDLHSQFGRGTTIKIKIPLTLAIIPALIVTSGGDRYAIPQVSLLELVRLDGEDARKRIEMIHGTPVYRLRGNLLPVVYLNRELQVGGAPPPPDPVNIVVLQADDRQFGLVVDSINDTEEIVVKPLGKQLKHIPLFAGATIMGDGRVALILDVLGIAQRAHVVSEERDRGRIEAADVASDQRNQCQPLLLLALGHEHRLAIPLGLVARLEELPRDAVEWADGQEVIQYRGEIMPLLRLSNLLGYGEENASGPMHIIVYSEGARSVGLVVGDILDIVETTLELRPSQRRPGILGSAVVQQRVTDLLDLPGILRAALPEAEPAVSA